MNLTNQDIAVNNLSAASSSALLHLLHLCDPTLPIGGFSHSAGLETYVQQKMVKDKTTANAFITEMLSRNLFYTDGAFVSLAFDCAANNNLEELIQLDVECSAVKLPVEMRQASRKLGIRLLKIFQPLLHNDRCNRYQQEVQLQNADGNYCIVYALFAQAMGIAKQDALYGFYYNAAAGLVTNSVKLIPLGQQDGQSIMFSLLPVMHSLAAASMQPNRSLLGVCCTGFDIRSMQHEQLYSRLYMS